MSLGLVALFPHPSNAAPMREVVSAVQHQPSRYEQVYKPDKNGKMYVYFEQWAKDGKYAERFTNGEMESRDNGKLIYCYWNSAGNRYQRVDTGESVGIDPVGVKEFSQFKLLKTETAGSHLMRYVFNIHQDLIVDTTTNLPTQRVCYNNDGSVMEIHVYHFQEIDDEIFEPHIKPGVPFYNIPEDRETLKAMVARTPQTVEVAGTTVKLYAVIVDRGCNVGAIVSGGDPRGTSQVPMQVDGMSKSVVNLPTEYTVLDPGANTLTVDDRPVRLDKVTFYPEQKIPDSFTLRIPVWRYDPNLRLNIKGRPQLLDSKVVGWAEFKVTNPLRTEQIEKVLPNWVSPNGAQDTGTAKTAK